MPPPTELRVAFINLGSPIAVDDTDHVAAETFFERLQLVAAELEELQPDIVALTDATWTRELETSAWDVLASALRMEPHYQRANPWFPGQNREASNATRDLVGFEEGDAILSRYPIRKGSRIALNPRASENEGRSALHVVMLIEPYGEVNVYISRLAGAEETREAQAADLRAQIEETGNGRPTLVFTDVGLGGAPGAVSVFTESGFEDLGAGAGDEAMATCCRTGMLFDVPPETPVGGEGVAPPMPTGDAPAGGDAGGDDDDPGTPASEGPDELAETRTLYVFSEIWGATSVDVFAERPNLRADGSRLYASDHNGVFAVLSLVDGWPDDLERDNDD